MQDSMCVRDKYVGNYNGEGKKEKEKGKGIIKGEKEEREKKGNFSRF
jgi:hypothetical protein